jgi:hypothetical protein
LAAIQAEIEELYCPRCIKIVTPVAVKMAYRG